MPRKGLNSKRFYFLITCINLLKKGSASTFFKWSWRETSRFFLKEVFALSDHFLPFNFLFLPFIRYYKSFLGGRLYFSLLDFTKFSRSKNLLNLEELSFFWLDARALSYDKLFYFWIVKVLGLLHVFKYSLYNYIIVNYGSFISTLFVARSRLFKYIKLDYLNTFFKLTLKGNPYAGVSNLLKVATLTTLVQFFYLNHTLEERRYNFIISKSRDFYFFLRKIDPYNFFKKLKINKYHSEKGYQNNSLNIEYYFFPDIDLFGVTKPLLLIKGSGFYNNLKLQKSYNFFVTSSYYRKIYNLSFPRENTKYWLFFYGAYSMRNILMPNYFKRCFNYGIGTFLDDSLIFWPETENFFVRKGIYKNVLWRGRPFSTEKEVSLFSLFPLNSEDFNSIPEDFDFDYYEIYRWRVLRLKNLHYIKQKWIIKNHNFYLFNLNYLRSFNIKINSLEFIFIYLILAKLLI